MTKNHEVEWVAAVLEWCRICRPDMVEQVREMIDGRQKPHEAFTFLLGIGFEAGRCFQHANPECPVGPIMSEGDWKPITAAVHESRGEPVPE